MARFLDEEFKPTEEDRKYEMFLREARKKVDPSKISEDEDGLIWWFFRCLYMDCRSHDFGRKANSDEELQLAAESQVICEILTAREMTPAV